jgi:hypothetical protein
VAQIVVPTTNTTITSAWGKSVADALNAGLVQGAIGAAAVDNNGIVTVAFPVAFAAPPAVVASFNTAGLTVGWRVNVSTITATTVLLRFYNEAGVVIGLGTNVGFTWIAVGPRA